MSLRQHKTKGISYWLFEAGRNKSLHLGPVNNLSKIKVERVKEALQYTTSRYSHYTDIEDTLIRLLPATDREEYVVKRLKELNEQATKLLRYLPD